MGHRKFCGSGFWEPWIMHGSAASVDEQIAWLNYKKTKLERVLKEIDQEIEDLKGSKE